MDERLHVLERRAPPPDLTLPYGAHADQVVDVRLPRAGRYDEPPPLVVVIHGGFWRNAYDRAHAGPQSAALAEAGYVVATIEYRRVRGPGGGWPRTFDDIALACDGVPSLAATALRQRVTPGPMVLVGHSAGGHLALWAAARHRLPISCPWHRASPPTVAGAVSLAGVVDLMRGDELGLGGDATRALLGGGAGNVPERYAVANPAALLPLGVPAALVHGTADAEVPVELSREYTRRASAAGDAVELTELAGVGHYELIDPLSAAWPVVLDAIARLSSR